VLLLAVHPGVVAAVVYYSLTHCTRQLLTAVLNAAGLLQYSAAAACCSLAALEVRRAVASDAPLVLV
jgi:hypothetical protein